jgi:ATP-dependent exoDNAse (exonuclease V) beta subunit
LTPQPNRLAAERTTDNARVVFDADYLRGHVSLGYAATVHSQQGVTADTCHAVLSESASRAAAYVAMTRGRDHNYAYIYTREDGEADHEHRRLLTDDDVHQVRRGTKHAAAHYLRMILGNDDRPITMHALAERTPQHQLPGVVANLLARNEQRRATRRETWRQHTAHEHARQATYHRITQTQQNSAERSHQRSRGIDGDGYGLEL